MKHADGIVVGKKDVDLTAPSHVAGVHQGNWPGDGRKMAEPRSGPSRSTGINPQDRTPIDPASPRLSPP